MARPTIEELRDRRINTMSADGRLEFYETLAVARLVLDVGEKVRYARETGGANAARPRRSCVYEPGSGRPP